ncbi:MAG: protein translocase subunit SecD [Candidatus Hydrogenedentota bacterium]
MEKSLTRTILIWGTIALAAIYVVPTVGWMTLSETAREERVARWAEEDTARAKERPGEFQALLHAVKRWSEFDRDWVINLGLDLQGGIHTVVSFNWQDLGEERIQQYRDAGYQDADIAQEVQQVVLQQITRRVNDFEAKEPIIQALGENQIQIQLPGQKDISRAVELIKMSAQLNFHIVAGPDETFTVFNALKTAFPEDFAAFIERPVPGGEGFRVMAENLERVQAMVEQANARGGIVPDDKIIAFSQPPKPFAEQVYSMYLLDKTPLASGEGLSGAGATPDQMNPPYWQIHFQFNNAAAADFGKATQANIGRAMAIVLDDLVVSAPVIRDRIGGSGQITGNFDGEEARDLAIALNSGSMKVPVKEEFTRKVSASLGAETITAGLTSALAGIAVVGIFMVIYYMSAGFFAVVSQVLNALFVIALMAYFDMTLTLPGIAGLILTIGMAVDANVLIFERIREEIKLGHSIKSSIENGFSRATVTIMDANITTLLAALVLFQFGTGPIQGFAITLSVGVITSVFTALVITRAMFDFAVERKLIAKIKMLSVVPADTKIDFMGKRIPATVLSLVLIVAGMAFFGFRGQENFGVDFKQGTNMVVQLDSEQDVTPDAVRELLATAAFGNPVVQESESGEGESRNEFLIRVSDTDAASAVEGNVDADTVAEHVRQTLAPLTKAADVSGVEVVDEQTVGPAVGAQLRYDAIQAVVYSIFFIMLYLAFRFELKYSVGALVALVHDVLITLGIFSLLGGEISLNVVAAVLTIIGYSLNDTIVVFDRIREDLKVYRGKNYSFIELINKSVNETLSRTILTSLTTLFVVGVLLVFGGTAINDFALVLFIGVIAGTYSTVFIANPVVYFWHTYQEKRRAAAESGKSGNRGEKARPAKRERAAT